MWIIAFLIAYLGIWLLIALHEFGHFFAARRAGVVVEEFRVGAAPDLYRCTFKSGLKFRLGSIPLMGWVRTSGDSFKYASRRSRIWIVLAGPLCSIVGGLIIATTPVLADTSWGFTNTRIDAIRRNSVAQRAGFEVGDRLLAIGEERINDWHQVPWKFGQALSGHLTMVLTAEHRVLKDSSGIEITEWISPVEVLQCRVLREEQEYTVDLTPFLSELRGTFPAPLRRGHFGAEIDLRQLGLLPVGPVEYVHYGRTPGRSFADELSWRWNRALYIWSPTGFWSWLEGSSGIPHLGSPVMSAGAIGPLTCLGFAFLTGPFFFLKTLGYCSLALGLANLFPIPPLDGGIFLQELFRKSADATSTPVPGSAPLSWRMGDVCTLLGLLFIIGLLLVAIWMDIRLVLHWIW